jgi:putative intracellular protease/amidase
MLFTDRRRALLLGLLATLYPGSALARQDPADRAADHNMSALPESWTRPDQIAMLAYPGMTLLDLVGPQYMFAALMGATVHIVGQTVEPVLTDTGVAVLPTTTFDRCPANLTVFFVPGGTAGTLEAMADPATRRFVADRGSRATYVTSVCTGSMILGAAGLLDGYQATSHWIAKPHLAAFGAIAADRRVVRDRNRITGAGVSAGLDFGLELIALLRDPTYAQAVQLMCEYDPAPPFNSGSPQTAPAEVAGIVSAMFEGFSTQLGELARSLPAQT